MLTADDVRGTDFDDACDLHGDAGGRPDAPEARLAPTVTLSSNATSV